MIYFVLILIFIILSAFFSGMETGLISLDRFRLEKEAKQDHSKKDLLNFVKNPDRLLGTTLIGTNISIVMISSLSTVALVKVKLLAGWVEKGYLSEDIATLITGIIVLVFAEVVPKALYRDYANAIVPYSFPVLKVFFFILQPFVFLVTILNNVLTKLFGISDTAGYQSLTKEDLSYILSETPGDQSLLPTQREMLEDALEFNELEAKNVMIPRTDMIAIPFNMPASEIIEIANKEGFTRYPVYRESLDDIIGILIIYDLLGLELNDTDTVEKFIREATFYPETMDVASLLKEMQAKRKSLAVIVDSYGGTAGIVTVEDILEELVGEIEDEYDEEERDVIKVNDDTYLALGFVEIDDLIDNYNIDLPQGDYETIAGLMIHYLAAIPKKGKSIEIDSWRIEAIQVSNRKVDRVKISRIGGK
jgi:CBS domain containing-hemolysin-like protein